ncbi:DUF6221 family protein [Microtetraspora sp. AC03309]|uniref:DUF6221 family protein n=1 Tax=Microtetraspora sp. AC03309 TaxID=2779376 RepID=UPI001E54C4F8|nr:hypothetical protein [Microtetraspora sp. AC03309]
MDDLIAFLRARIAEAEEIAGRCEPGHRFSSRTADDGGSWVDVGEHAQAEHLLRLEAAAHGWHSDCRPERRG